LIADARYRLQHLVFLTHRFRLADSLERQGIRQANDGEQLQRTLLAYGSWLADQPLTGPAPVREGDAIRLGSARFTYRPVAGTDSTRPVNPDRPAVFCPIMGGEKPHEVWLEQRRTRSEVTLGSFDLSKQPPFRSGEGLSFGKRRFNQHEKGIVHYEN
jgi:hypothetical protein